MMKTQFAIRCIASLLMLGLSVSSTRAIAEDAIPFRSMMQSAGAEPAVPPKPDAKDASTASMTKHTDSGKTERVTGAILIGTGVAVMAVTLGVVATLHGSFGHSGRVWAGIGGGGAITGVGVTLVVLGNHKKPSN